MDLSTTPARGPPKGVTPNFSDSAPSRQGTIIGVCSTMMIVTTAFVAMRLYVAFRLTKSAALDSGFCVMAVLFSFAYMAILMHLSYASRHMWDVPLAWMFADENYWKLRLSQNLMNPLAFFFSRIPIFLLYLRLFGSLRSFRWACYAGIVAAFAIYLHTIPVVAVLCTPQAGEKWTDIATFHRCSQGKPDAVAQGVGNIVLDLYGLLLPLPVIWGLRMPMKKKMGVMVVFLTGSFAFIASCVSLYYRIRLTYGDDTNWYEGAYDAASAVEINIAIICSCMPSLSSLMKAVVKDGSFLASFRSMFRSQGSQSNRGFSANAMFGKSISEQHELRDPFPLTKDSLSESQTQLNSIHE